MLNSTQRHQMLGTPRVKSPWHSRTDEQCFLQSMTTKMSKNPHSKNLAAKMCTKPEINVRTLLQCSLQMSASTQARERHNVRRAEKPNCRLWLPEIFSYSPSCVGQTDRRTDRGRVSDSPRKSAQFPEKEKEVAHACSPACKHFTHALC